MTKNFDPTKDQQALVSISQTLLSIRGYIRDNVGEAPSAAQIRATVTHVHDVLGLGTPPECRLAQSELCRLALKDIEVEDAEYLRLSSPDGSMLS